MQSRFLKGSNRGDKCVKLKENAQLCLEKDLFIRVGEEDFLFTERKTWNISSK